MKNRQYYLAVKVSELVSIARQSLRSAAHATREDPELGRNLANAHRELENLQCWANRIQARRLPEGAPAGAQAELLEEGGGPC